MMRAKSECDSTSITPTSSPKRAVYYVQSPSRDSHEDADKSSASASMQTTPAYNSSSSPMDSPSHPSTYRTSSNYRSSSASRVSGHWPWSRGNRKRNNSKQWRECRVIIEENVGYDYEGRVDDEGRRPYCLIGLFGFALVFSAFCLIIWGASKPYKAHIRMMSLKVHDFYFGQGSDFTGVPTKMMTVNCTATMSIYNPATFFGIYVSSDQVDLMYSQITVASGQLKKYFQPRRSSRFMSVNLGGRNIPLYGAGATLVATDDIKGIPLKLDVEVQSKGYIVGKLVKTKHRRQISCSLVVNSWGTSEIKFKRGSCFYD